jgi:hypothetical protein
MSAEEWRRIPGYEGYYEASSLGRIRSINRRIDVTAKRGTFKRVLKGSLRKQVFNPNNGYLYVAMSRDGIVTMMTVHEIIALTFHGERPTGLDICHGDGNRLNCRSDNLRYGTKKENFADAQAHGVIVKGERHANAKLTAPEVIEIRRLFGTLPQIEIGRRFGVTQGAIRRIGLGLNWKHLLKAENTYEKTVT